MPKVSYVQMIGELESAVTLVRLNADVVPELALTVADELEGTAATIKEMKQEQRSLLAAQMEKTAQLAAVVSQGTKNARQIRAYVALCFCHKKQAVLSQFGIRDRRRPRRKTRSRSSSTASPIAEVPQASSAALNPAEHVTKPVEEARQRSRWTRGVSRARGCRPSPSAAASGRPAARGRSTLRKGETSSGLGETSRGRGRGPGGWGDVFARRGNAVGARGAVPWFGQTSLRFGGSRFRFGETPFPIGRTFLKPGESS